MIHLCTQNPCPLQDKEIARVLESGFTSHYTKGEHYDAQAHYAKMLFAVIKIPKWRHPIASFKAFLKTEKFKDSHKECCEWARERD